MVNGFGGEFPAARTCKSNFRLHYGYGKFHYTTIDSNLHILQRRV